MRPIGFSTGALARSDFRAALDSLQYRRVNAVELSALRYAELSPLLKALGTLNLRAYKHVGIHAPSCFDQTQEEEIASLLRGLVPSQWPIVMHPDTIHDYKIWEPFGSQLAIENMDRRKPTGRTLEELSRIFDKLPNAKLCFDIGHARQCDTTMTEAFRILTEFRDRITWMHISEVNTQSQHESLSFAAISSFMEVASLIPDPVPAILESRVAIEDIDAEIAKAEQALSVEAYHVIAS
jgi:hypothetical protein